MNERATQQREARDPLPISAEVSGRNVVDFSLMPRFKRQFENWSKWSAEQDAATARAAEQERYREAYAKRHPINDGPMRA